MNREQQDAFDAVEQINDEIYVNWETDYIYMPQLLVTFSTGMTLIGLSVPSENNLPEFHLYDSENDDRIFYEETNEYETFYKYIKRKFKLIKKEINKVNL